VSASQSFFAGSFEQNNLTLSSTPIEFKL